MLILIIAGGPDKGRIYELTDGEPIVLGREGDQVKLNDRKVSREHARLWSEGGQWYLEDLGSRHGTYRNHAELEKGQRAKLKDGDYLQIGNTVMVLGRMPAGHAEGMALLGDQQSSTPMPKRRTMAIAGGVAVVALLGLGGYLAYELHNLRGQTVSADEFAILQKQLVEAQRQQVDRIEQSIGESTGLSRQLLSRHQQLATTLDDTNRAIGEHGNAVTQATESLADATDPLRESLASINENAIKQQQAIARMGEMLAEQQANDNSDKLLAAVTDMKSLLGDQPNGQKLVAMLEEAIDANAQAAGEAVKLALAEHRKSADTDALASAKSTEDLLNRVLEGLAKVPTRAQLAEEVRLAVAESKAQDEQFMRLVLAELRRTGDQITTDVTAAVGEDAGQAQALMKQVVAELDKRPTGEQLAADLQQAMEEALASKDTKHGELAALMGQVLTELEQRPTSEQLAADLRRYIGEDGQRTELLVARVMAELEQRPTAEQIASELQSTDNESAAKTAMLLEQVLSKIDTQGELAGEIAALRKQIETLPGRDSEAVRAVLARLDEQDRNNNEMLAAIAQLREAMPSDLPNQLDKVLAQLDEQVRTEQITDAIDQAMQRIAAAQDKQTQATLAAFSERLEALPSAEQLAKATKSQDELAVLLNKSDAREAIGELRATLEQLAERMSGEPDDRLGKILTMLEKREKAELMLAELHDAMGNQSEQTEKLKREVLAAIAEMDQPQTQKTLNELLGLVEDRLLTDESVRQAIRDEMRGTVIPNQRAISDARDVTTTPTTSGNDADATPALPQRRLTRLEAAYKQSFETGDPVTVGAGVVDPNTGEVSKGRLIDPAVAKALGFDTWRDWYLTDRHAEQMRLQQQAIRQRNANESGDDGTVNLPPVENKRDNQRPEKD